jgi:hypothetical protein
MSLEILLRHNGGVYKRVINTVMKIEKSKSPLKTNKNQTTLSNNSPSKNKNYAKTTLKIVNDTYNLGLFQKDIQVLDKLCKF